MEKFDSKMIDLCMHAGCGTYMQGIDNLQKIGELLKSYGVSYPLIVAGKTAFLKAGDSLTNGLVKNNFSYGVEIYTGPCVIEDAQILCMKVHSEKHDCVIGLGGGKVLDLSKTLGDFARVPVFTIPTIAATCAATTPLSAMYGHDGKFVKNLYHTNSVAGVIVDLNVLVSAPSRYLAAGIADALAKSCEYSAFNKSMEYRTSNFGRYVGYRLAQVNDSILLSIANEAYDSNNKGIVTRAFCDAVSCIIPITGIVSGLGAYSAPGGARFALAHAFNELIRSKYQADVNRWLHGELVGVGVLCQLYVNKISTEEFDVLLEIMHSLNLPCSLRDLEMDVSEVAIERFVDELCEIKQIDLTLRDNILNAVKKIC